MTQVAVRKSEDSAMDLSVKCGMITFHRTSSGDETFDRDETDDSDNAFLQIQLRKRHLERADVEPNPSPPSCEQTRRHWYRAVACRPDSDTDSRFSASYSPLQSGASANGLTARNRRQSPLEDTLARQQTGCPGEEAEAFLQTQHRRTAYVPVEYVPQMQGLNGVGMARNDDDFTTSQLQQQRPTQSDSSIQYPEFVSFGYHPFAETVYGNGVAASTPPGCAASTRGPSRLPPPGVQGLAADAARGVNGCCPVSVRPSTVFNPRKRFLTEIRAAAAAGEATAASPPSSEPGGAFASLPTAEVVAIPSSSEERRCYAAASRAGSAGGSSSSCYQEKDEAYWERRRKNNEAAKRSRDIRRQKEEQVAARAASLSAENVQLRAQIEVLKTQLALIQSMVISNAHRSA